jgi:hypothetical protein
VVDGGDCIGIRRVPILGMLVVMEVMDGRATLGVSHPGAGPQDLMRRVNVNPDIVVGFPLPRVDVSGVERDEMFR